MQMGISLIRVFMHLGQIDFIYYISRIIIVIITPAKENIIPFLKTEVLGRNIQKDEITKNIKETPKKIFNQ